MEYTKDNPLKVVTLCSGYDSQCLALNRIKQHYKEFEYELIAWAEVDKYAIEAHNVLFPQYAGKNMGDITTCDWGKITTSIDLLTYSTPCTNISVAGKQEGLKEGSGTASSIIWSVLRAIDTLHPRYLLMENVKALVSNKFIGDFKQWQGELAKRDYTNFVKVLDSSQFGVPQHRERVFMVSILDENASYHFPEPFPLERKLKDVLEKDVDEKYYLSEKIIKGFFAHAERHKNDGFKFNPTDGNVVANTILASSQCRPCDNYIKEIGNLYNDNKQAGRVYDADGISPTLDNMASVGNKSPKIVEYLSCAMRGRNLDNPSDRVKGCVTGQRLEIGDDKANTITTVQKDSMVVEPQVLTPKRNEYGKAVRKEYESGLFDESRHNMTGLAPSEDSVSNTITSVQKDNLLCEPRANNISYKITKDGKIRAYQNDERKSGVSEFQIDNENAVASTVTTAHTPKCYGESLGFRIRKLTPREVFRLMDADDEEIDKLLNSGISNTQLYKMAGNSICTSVLYHIFRKLFIEKDNENQQLTLF